MHIGDVPLVGGMAMMGGLVIGSFGFLPPIQGFTFYAAALALLVGLGAADDRFDLPSRARLAVQSCAALLIAVGGTFVTDLGAPFLVGTLELGWLAIPFTVLIVVTAINAFNMFDGSDGIAGSQALIALLYIGMLGLQSGATQYIPLIAALLGCVVAFLLFNWPARTSRPLRVFLGDAGSTMLGFTFAWLSIELSQGSGRAMSPVVALWIFALPVFDLFSSIIRRLRRRQSPLQPDADHLHHLLSRLGLSSRNIALLVVAAATLLGAIGVGGFMLHVPDGVLFIAWLLGGSLYYVGVARGLRPSE